MSWIMFSQMHSEYFTVIQKACNVSANTNIMVVFY